MDNNFVHWYGGGLESVYSGMERTVAVEFYMDKATNKDACMFISMGKVDANTPASVITLSDFKLMKFPGRPSSSGSWDSWSDDGGWKAPIVDFGDGWEVSYWFGKVGQCSKSSGIYHIEILDTGSLDWHVQMQKKGIVLEKGKIYRMSFEARSSLDRTISCALQKDGTNDDDWTSYSGGSGLYQINGEWQEFTHEFTMSNDTDRNVIYNISLGAVSGRITNAHDVYFRNIILEEVPDKPVEPVPVGEEMLTGEWEKNVNAEKGGKANIVEKDGIITVEISDVGTEDYAVQVRQLGLMLEEDCTYEFKCNADFDNGERIIKVGVMQDGTYEWYGGNDLTIGTSKGARASSGQWMKFAGTTGKEYSFTFTVTKPTISDGMLAISMGQIYKDIDKSQPIYTPTGTVTLSNISLKKISDKTEEPDNPDVPEDMGLDLVADVDGNLLKGKIFDIEETAGAVRSVSKDKTKIKITNVGTEDYGVKLKLAEGSKLALEAGCTYEFAADVKFEAAEGEMKQTRTIKVGFMDQDYGKWYGGTDEEITNESRTITASIALNTDDDNVNFFISMGKIEGEETPKGTITISNLSLVKKSGGKEPDDPGDTDLTLIADRNDNLLKGKILDINAYGSATIVDKSSDNTKVTITNVGTEDWNVQLHLMDDSPKLAMEKGCTYEFTADAKFDAADGETVKTRTIKVGFLSQDNDWYGGSEPVIKSVGSKIDAEVTMTKDDDNVKFVISMGQIKDEAGNEITTPTGTVTLSNLLLVKKSGGDKPDDPKPEVPEAPAKLIASVDGNMLDLSKIKSDNMDGATPNDVLTQFEISDLGSASWNVSIEQEKLPLVEGHKYRFKGTVYSNTERKIEVCIQSAKGDYPKYAGDILSFEAGEKKEIEEEFTYNYTGTGEDPVRFFVGMGKVDDSDEAGTVQLSDFSLVDITESASTDTESISTLSSDTEIEASSFIDDADEEKTDEDVVDEETEDDEDAADEETEDDEEIQENTDEDLKTDEKTPEDTPDDYVTPETVDASLNEDDNDSDDSN